MYIDLSRAQIQRFHGVDYEVYLVLGTHPVSQVRRHLQRSVAVNIDETGCHARNLVGPEKSVAN